jgi:hypothetical protein
MGRKLTLISNGFIKQNRSVLEAHFKKKKRLLPLNVKYAGIFGGKQLVL